MADTIKIRRDTEARWQQASNIVLEEGEIGLIMPKTQSLTQPEPIKCKVGDGVHTWAQLPQQSWISLAGTTMPSASGMIPVYNDSGSVVPTTESLARIVESLKNLEESVFSLDVAFDTGVEDVLEYDGTDDLLTFHWTASRFDDPKVPQQVTYYRTGSRTSDYRRWDTEFPTEASGSWQDSYSALGSVTYGMEVMVDYMLTKVEDSVSWVLPCYLGFFDSGSSLAFMRENGLTKIVTSSIGSKAGNTYTLNNTAETPKYMTLCIPQNMTFQQIRSNGFEVPLQEPELDNSLVIGGSARTYKIYRSAGQINPGEMVIDIYTAS